MIKKVRTPEYNYDFDTATGFFKRWGATRNEEAEYSPLGAEIADIEISTVCHGIRGVPCRYCYKSNTGEGANMSLETFKRVFDHLPTNVGQIAFGIGDIDGNPDMFSIFKHCRDHNVVPNVTINGWGLTHEIAQKLALLCGAVAVSNHVPAVCYDAVEMLYDAGLRQVNIHQVISRETLAQAHTLIDDCLCDPRLHGLNAVVFLSLKRVGRGAGNTVVSDKDFKSLVQHAIDFGIAFGFDSCSCSKFILHFAESNPELIKYAEPCESTLFSIYIDVRGNVYPCSFTASKEWYLGSLLCDDLMTIWKSEKIAQFRAKLRAVCRVCPIHHI